MEREISVKKSADKATVLIVWSATGYFAFGRIACSSQRKERERAEERVEENNQKDYLKTKALLVGLTD